MIDRRERAIHACPTGAGTGKPSRNSRPRVAHRWDGQVVGGGALSTVGAAAWSASWTVGMVAVSAVGRAGAGFARVTAVAVAFVSVLVAKTVDHALQITKRAELFPG